MLCTPKASAIYAKSRSAGNANEVAMPVSSIVLRTTTKTGKFVEFGISQELAACKTLASRENPERKRSARVTVNASA